MDRAVDRAMTTMHDRFGDLVTELNDVDALLREQLVEMRRTNELLEQLAGRGAG